MSTSSSPPITNGWFILHFEDLENNLEKHILYLNNTKQSISDAARQLGGMVFERLGQLGGPGSGVNVGLKSLSVVGLDSIDLEITFFQLVTHIRDLPPSPEATKPDLFGLGSNKLRITFKYTDI